MTTFAAIDVGSYEVSMKIFQFQSGRMKEIEHIRSKLFLGTDTHRTGKISNENLNELCRILREFKQIMLTYKVDEYRTYGTSAIREMKNEIIILDQIEQRTGIRIKKLSNSEQRFLGYKGIAIKGETFDEIIQKPTAIVDISGASLQISLFDKDRLITTQRIKLGILRLEELLNYLEANETNEESYVRELLEPQIETFKKMFLKEKMVNNVILIDDYISYYLSQHGKQGENKSFWSNKNFFELMDMVVGRSRMEISQRLNITEQNAKHFTLSGIVIERIVESLGVELIWAPGTSLCDGIAYDYAEANKLIAMNHNFEQDIIAAALNISKRYMGSRKRSETIEALTQTIFTSMKKIHGLGKREQLLLRIASIMHDCGKYINMTDLGEASYSIIMGTEIIGLSHIEREIVAQVVCYNHDEFNYNKSLDVTRLDEEPYLVMAKLTAILRVANGLDRSHKQKFKSLNCKLKEDKLTITVDSNEDISVEKTLFRDRAKFFKEVFNVEVVIKQKKTV